MKTECLKMIERGSMHFKLEKIKYRLYFIKYKRHLICLQSVALFQSGSDTEAEKQNKTHNCCKLIHPV